MASEIIMFHRTTTGENDETLHSILKNGLRSPSGLIENVGQKNGLFVNSNHDLQQYLSTSIHMEEVWGKMGGRPLLLTVKCAFGAGFDLDYEDSIHIALPIFSHFQEVLSHIPPDVLTLKNGQVIHSVRSIDEPDKKGLEIVYSDAQGRQNERFFLAWDGNEQFKYGHDNVTEIFQTLRDYLVVTCGKEYLEYEEQQIRLAVQADEFQSGISMKAHGSNVPEVLKAEVWDGQKWEEVPLPAKDMQDPARRINLQPPNAGQPPFPP